MNKFRWNTCVATISGFMCMILTGILMVKFQSPTPLIFGVPVSFILFISSPDGVDQDFNMRGQ